MSLSLAKNKHLTDVDICVLGTLLNLEDLNLGGTSVTGNGLCGVQELNAFQSLRRVNFHSTFRRIGI